MFQKIFFFFSCFFLVLLIEELNQLMTLFWTCYDSIGTLNHNVLVLQTKDFSYLSLFFERKNFYLTKTDSCFFFWFGLVWLRVLILEDTFRLFIAFFFFNLFFQKYLFKWNKLKIVDELQSFCYKKIIFLFWSWEALNAMRVRAKLLNGRDSTTEKKSLS